VTHLNFGFDETASLIGGALMASARLAYAVVGRLGCGLL
jgi:hypothetical protein